MKYYVVDAFTDELFKGNPAGVCVLERPIPKELMQSIAAENNLSETAFVIRRERGEYDLRWFTTVSEIDLCGHATMGTAHAVATFVDPGIKEMHFHTMSGLLTVTAEGNRYTLDFPARTMEATSPMPDTEKALGVKALETYRAREIIMILSDEDAVRNARPDFERLKGAEGTIGFIISAPGKNEDFVSRCFYPDEGIQEDPVTGSAHCYLTPYWSKKTGKTDFRCAQLSARGGKLACSLRGDRVKITGSAVLYLSGEISIKE